MESNLVAFVRLDVTIFLLRKNMIMKTITTKSSFQVLTNWKEKRKFAAVSRENLLFYNVYFISNKNLAL